MFRPALALCLAALASGCSLLIQFDHDSQPCDSAGECAPTHTCVAGVCRPNDGGVTPTGGGTGGGGAVGGGGGTTGGGTGDGGCTTRETACGNGVDDDCDGLKDCADSDCSGLVCNDGDPCTDGEVCSNSTCMRGPAKVCNTPPTPCQSSTGTCTPGTGVCVYTSLPDGTSCGAKVADRCCGGTCVNTTLVTAHCGGCGLACGTGQLCQSINQSACGRDPIDTSGRCSCSGTAPCPAGQTCGINNFCVPTAVAQCAPGEVIANADGGCSNYCRY
ncbi:MAG: hypothetical protein U0228_22925 [Myxococcaceae bacterium]